MRCVALKNSRDGDRERIWSSMIYDGVVTPVLSPRLIRCNCASIDLEMQADALLFHMSLEHATSL